MNMLDELFLHENTRNNVKSFIKSTSQALLLVGDSNSGRKTLLLAIAHDLGATRAEQQIIISDKEPSIGINQARSLRATLKLRPVKNSVFTVIIPDAEKLTHEAQNALLKIVEEPPERTYFLLSAQNQNLLLPTILSRAVTVYLQQIKKRDLSRTLVDRGYSVKNVENAIRSADGKIGLTVKLLNDDAEKYVNCIARAKEILSMALPDRLMQIDKLIKDDQINDLLSSMSRILRAGVEVALQKQTDLDPWERRLRFVEDSKNALLSNVNRRILLLRLMLQL